MLASVCSTLDTRACPSGYTARMLRRDDIAALQAMREAADAADDTTTAGTLAEVAAEFEDRWCPAESNYLVVLSGAGQLVASGRVAANPQPDPDDGRAFLEWLIHPQHRAGAVTGFVFDWMEARACATLSARPAPHKVLRAGGWEHLPADLALCVGRGYRPLNTWQRMHLDLRAPLPACEPPDGVAIVPYRPEMARAIFAAYDQAFRDHREFDVMSEEAWRKYLLDVPAFRPDLTFVAVHGDEVVGTMCSMVDGERAARTGRREVLVRAVGVPRAWRRRGIAFALMARALQAYRAAGLDDAVLNVDGDSPTGAQRVYERLGFSTHKRFIEYEKELEV